METVLPEWLQLSPEGVTAADYAALPEDVCRRVEIVDGAVVVLPAPLRSHQLLARRLADVLEANSGLELAVVTGADLRIQEAPLVKRRPDIAVYDARVPDEQVLRPADCQVVVEVMSSGSATADRLGKPAEYAATSIGHYWRIEVGDSSASFAMCWTGGRSAT
ncbi:Uma2 family endonuclease [Amycolatopsis nalaikhensis]|uniref:Uma2 family endonuclease n=1 Tax=Amycolatopsis nalaikhensis TaxID=715472 RepID=A0ABY8XDN2_9PSEU|nr:Uma2 family endonuclease [Amycolatopsis sp. 2-2]WIV52937.1 Uma2 family endonuclease [Amycolatopsis sp. 2-2]